jgi:hypothetical protein
VNRDDSVHKLKVNCIGLEQDLLNFVRSRYIHNHQVQVVLLAPVAITLWLWGCRTDDEKVVLFTLQHWLPMGSTPVHIDQANQSGPPERIQGFGLEDMDAVCMMNVETRLTVEYNGLTGRQSPDEVVPEEDGFSLGGRSSCQLGVSGQLRKRDTHQFLDFQI